MNECHFDQIVADFYKSAAGEQPWGVGLERVRQIMRAQVVNLYGMVKATRSVALSFEVGEASPQAALDFILKYHQIDCRAQLGMSMPVGQVVSCHRHFDDRFVESDPFFQEFLIPYGGRYASGMKLYEDEEQVVFFGIHRPLGMPPLDDGEEALTHRLGVHLRQAFVLYLRQQKRAQPASVGIELLKRLPQPMVLTDEHRRILFKNEGAERLMRSSDVLQDRQGLLCGPRSGDDAQLLIALRALHLSTQSYLVGDAKPMDKIFLRLQNSLGIRVGLYLYALRSAHSMGAFGPQNLALILLHDPTSQAQLDPFAVAATWDLTPAEAKAAIALYQKLSIPEIAERHGVSINTVRTQVQSAMVKMGVSRQAELVACLATLPPMLA
jgi:DNA-binding CsgD family transcriptional regulator